MPDNRPNGPAPNVGVSRNAAYPYGVPDYAGVVVRLFAWLIDMAIMGVPLAILGVTRFSLAAFDPLSPLSRAILFRFSVLDILAWAIPVIYFTALTYSYGATLGKMLLKLEVVPADGGRLTLRAVLVREVFARYLSSFAWIGYWMIFPDREKRALHDRLADTRVIYAHTRRMAPRPRPAQPVQRPQPVTPQPVTPPEPQAVSETPQAVSEMAQPVAETPQAVAESATPPQAQRVNLEKSADTGESVEKSADTSETVDKSGDTGESVEKSADTGETQA